MLTLFLFLILGRDCSTPPGGFRYPNPIPKARATMFANLDGSDGQLEQTTCFGNFPGGQWVSKAFLPVGVTGIAAVNPTVYGSRYEDSESEGWGRIVKGRR
jgi:hypothetical protein